MAMNIITITVKCDLDNDEIFGRVHVQTTADRTLDWLLDEFCTEKRVKRKDTFALRSDTSPELNLTQTISQAGLTDGQTIYAYNKNPPPPPTELPKVPPPALSTWWILASCFLIVGAFGLIVILAVHLTLSRPAEAFGVVVDSGADTTKVFLYGWRASKYRGNGVVGQRAYAKSASPIESASGISQMQEAVTAVKNYVPPKLEAKSRLYLGATAGLRMYRQVSASLAESVLASARAALTSNGLRFDLGNATDSIRILEGDEEARAAWVAVNYLRGSFGNLAAYEHGSAKEPPQPPEATFGSLDLGAGSAQIAFASFASASSPLPPGIQPITVYGQTRTVYAHSFPCYGKEVAHRRALGRVIFEAGFNNGVPVDFPCWQLGYSDQVLARDVFVSPCSDGIFTVPAGKLDAKFLVTGSGDPSRCRLLVARFFSSFCDKASCSFNNVYQPDLAGRFVAFAGYFHVAKFFNLTATSSRAGANLTEVSVLVDGFCSKAYKAAADVPEAFMRWYCFDGVYTESLLRGFGFNESNWRNIQFLDTISMNHNVGNKMVQINSNIGWPVGFMIMKSAEVPPEGLILAIPLPVFVFLLVLFILLLMLSVVFACLAVRFGKAGKKRGYSPF